MPAATVGLASFKEKQTTSSRILVVDYIGRIRMSRVTRKNHDGILLRSGLHNDIASNTEFVQHLQH